MSLSELLVPNLYQIFANSVTTPTPIVNNNISAYYTKLNSQSIPNNINTNVTWDIVSEIPTVTYLAGNFTINLSGVYSFTANITWASINPFGNRELFFYVNEPINNITIKYSDSNIPTISADSIFNSSTLIKYFNVGDVVSVGALQSGGVSVDILNLNPNTSQLVISRLA